MINNSKRELVLSQIDNIKEWLGSGMSIGSVAKAVGVSRSTLYKYLGDAEAGVDSLDNIKKMRQPAVDQLEDTMFKHAIGFEHTIKRHAKVKRTMYDNGKKAEEWEEMVEYEETLYFPPDTTAGIFLLKNWSNYMNEPRAMEMRKKELEIKESQVW